MSDTLEDLGWPEAKIFDISFQSDSLTFRMLDLLSYGDPLKFEVVKVAISDIEALRIEISPYINGKYHSKFVPVNFGNATHDDEGFEGITHENPFSDIKADYFWISSDLRAKNIEIERTAVFEYVQRQG